MSFRRLVLSSLTALAAAACGPSTTSSGPTTVTPPPGEATTPTGGPVAHDGPMSLADVGLEPASLDKTVDPCQDFFQYACGGWVKANPIPSDRARWARFSELDEKNTAALRGILDDARAGKSTDPTMQRLGAFYGACMDEAAVEAGGTAAIDPLLKQAAEVKDAKGVAAALIALHQVGVYAVFDHATEADFADSTVNVLFVDTNGLGLPDRDYYLDKSFKDKVAAYEAHLGRVFTMLGKDAKASAQAVKDVMAIETALAKLTRTRTARRDAKKSYNPVDRAGLKKAAPWLDWDAYLTAIGAPDAQKIVLTTPEFMKGVAKVIKGQKPAAWANYLQYHIVADTAETLPKKFVDEAFTLEAALSGKQTQRDRWKRCVDATETAMADDLSKPYVDRHFPGASKQIAVTLVGALADAMGAELQHQDWMSEQTRGRAVDKLAKLDRLIGYPDVWKTYDFAVDPKGYAKNALAAEAFELKREAGKVGKPVDRKEWHMPAHIVNAYYNPLANNTGLPAGILQPPFFAAKRSVAANLGGIGMVIGHELTHGFDDEGAKFDAEGNMKDWWQKEDADRFAAKGECLAAQYSTFEVLPGEKLNGKLTLGENIADLGGVKMAFRAYRALRKGETPVVAEGLTEDQQFFVAVGQAWCSSDRPEEAKRRVTVDPHSAPNWRVNGSLRNLPEFAEAFQCKAGSPMVPANTCAVW